MVLLAEIFFIVFALAGFSGGQRALGRRRVEDCVDGKVPRVALGKRCGNKDEGESWRPGILKRERRVESR